jgi:hypothetical protein
LLLAGPRCQTWNTAAGLRFEPDLLTRAAEVGGQDHLGASVAPVGDRRQGGKEAELDVDGKGGWNNAKNALLLMLGVSEAE